MAYDLEHLNNDNQTPTEYKKFWDTYKVATSERFPPNLVLEEKDVIKLLNNHRFNGKGKYWYNTFQCTNLGDQKRYTKLTVYMQK